MNLRFFLFLSIVLALAAEAALADDHGWQRREYAAARLVTDSASRAGVEIKLHDGWHTYWRMAGDSGLPPRFEWADSRNIKTVTVHWPVPKRFTTGNLYTFGYDSSVLFPLSLEAEKQGEAATLGLALELMVCNTICVPQDFKLTLDVPSNDRTSAQEGDEIAKAIERLPRQEETDGLKIESAVIGPRALVIKTYAAQRYEDADVFIETPPDTAILSAPPEITPDEKDIRYATIRIPAPEDTANLADLLMKKDVTITLKTREGAIEKKVSF